MMDMIERVAWALTAAFKAEGREFDGGQAEDLARAAIEAMREPSEAMLDHAFSTVRADSDNMQCPDFYRAMIDAALSKANHKE